MYIALTGYLKKVTEKKDKLNNISFVISIWIRTAIQFNQFEFPSISCHYSLNLFWHDFFFDNILRDILFLSDNVAALLFLLLIYRYR